MVWHIGPQTGRTDPFVAWVREMMRARFGVSVTTQTSVAGADLLTLPAPATPSGQPWRRSPCGAMSYAVLSPGGRGNDAAATLSRFLLAARSHRPELGFA